MATRSLFSRIELQRIRSLSSTQRHLNVGRVIYNKPTSSSSSQSAAAQTGNVPGLSNKVVDTPSGPVGPGATKDSKHYKNPEYFSYNTMSYHEAEIEMLKYRCPQPSNKRPA